MAAGRITHAEHAIRLHLELIGGLAQGRTKLRASEWWDVVRRLNPADARVVVLRILHGLTNREIAERLEVSHGIPDQRWQRAVVKLKTGRVRELLA